MFKKFLLTLGVVTLTAGLALAEGEVEKGKKLFEDPKLGTSGKSCASCHPGGHGLEGSATKKEFKIMGKTQKSLEEAINFCIVNALKGKALDPKSKEMQALTAYLKSLAGKKTEAPKKKKIEGC